MQPIAYLKKEDLSNIKLICFDCDGVTVEKGTQIEEKGNLLRILTHGASPEFTQKIAQLKKHYHIVFNSGRSSMHLVKIYNNLLWDNISFISEIGIFILHQGQLIQNEPLTKYELDTIKTIKSKLFKLLESNPDARGFEPKQFLITLHCHKAIPEVEKIVKDSDPRNEFYCWWNEEAYDINPKRFNKATGLKKLLDLMGLDFSNVVTVGNGINDHNMTDAAGISVSTDPDHLKADFYIGGEDLGGEIFADKLLELS